MKNYPKQFEDVYDVLAEGDIRTTKLGSTLGSAEKLAIRFRKFYKEFHRTFFSLVVNHIWLEQQFLYGRDRRKKRHGNGYSHDWAFAFFMKNIVGFNQKTMTTNFCFTAVATYLKDFFPDFLNHDPEKEPELYKFPYENITIDHLVFVHMVHNRIELLEEADRRAMSFVDFCNWSTNHVFCYNEEVGKEIYVLTNNHFFWPYIKNTAYGRGWASENFNFDLSLTSKNKK